MPGSLDLDQLNASSGTARILEGEGQASAKAMAFWENTLRYLYLPPATFLRTAIQSGGKSRDFLAPLMDKAAKNLMGFNLAMPRSSSRNRKPRAGFASN